MEIANDRTRVSKRRKGRKSIFVRQKIGARVQRVAKSSHQHSKQPPKSRAAPIFRIPLEVRETIYALVVKYALHPAPERYYSPSRSFSFLEVKLPPIGLVCRQLFREVVSVFFANNRFYFDVVVECDQNKHPCKWAGMSFLAHNIVWYPLGDKEEAEAAKIRSKEFIGKKLQSLRAAIEQSPPARLVLPAEETRTYEPAEYLARYPHHQVVPRGAAPLWRDEYLAYHLTDFPLGKKIRWGSWSWLKLVEGNIRLPFVKLRIHLEKTADDRYRDKPDLQVQISAEKHGQSNKYICKVDWFRLEDHMKKNKLLLEEITQVTEGAVEAMSSRAGFRGFTLADMELLATAFEFEKGAPFCDHGLSLTWPYVKFSGNCVQCSLVQHYEHESRREQIYEDSTVEAAWAAWEYDDEDEEDS